MRNMEGAKWRDRLKSQYVPDLGELAEYATELEARGVTHVRVNGEPVYVPFAVAHLRAYYLDVVAGLTATAAELEQRDADHAATGAEDDRLARLKADPDPLSDTCDGGSPRSTCGTQQPGLFDEPADNNLTY